MAHSHLATTLARFTARMHRTKNRLISMPAAVQAELGLERRAENDLLLVSIRKGGAGRWNHHYVKLTFDNELAIPSDVSGIQPGDAIEVKVHAIYSGTPRPIAAPRAGGAALLLQLAADERPGWRTDGSVDVDAYLAAQDRPDGDDVR
jgi:hypothetical protein